MLTRFAVHASRGRKPRTVNLVSPFGRFTYFVSSVQKKTAFDAWQKARCVHIASFLVLQWIPGKYQCSHEGRKRKYHRPYRSSHEETKTSSENENTSNNKTNKQVSGTNFPCHSAQKKRKSFQNHCEAELQKSCGDWNYCFTPNNTREYIRRKFPNCHFLLFSGTAATNSDWCHAADRCNEMTLSSGQVLRKERN